MQTMQRKSEANGSVVTSAAMIQNSGRTWMYQTLSLSAFSVLSFVYSPHLMSLKSTFQRETHYLCTRKSNRQDVTVIYSKEYMLRQDQQKNPLLFPFVSWPLAQQREDRTEVSAPALAVNHETGPGVLREAGSAKCTAKIIVILYTLYITLCTVHIVHYTVYYL